MAKAKRVIPRERAHRDVEEAIDHYLREASPKLALVFVEELEKAYSHLARHPASGSPRYAHELGLAELRFWRLTRFPFLVFYVERDDHVDIWRVLHEQRQIPAWLLET